MVAKVIELVASSPTSFGLKVAGFNVKVNEVKLREYRVNVKTDFGVERWKHDSLSSPLFFQVLTLRLDSFEARHTYQGREGKA